MPGPREQAVRAALPNRPAAALYSDDSEWRHKIAMCFAGLHNGARNPGAVTPGGKLFLGKAECEWDWREVWPRMVQMGLVEFCLHPRANHPNVGGFTVVFAWGVTEHGRVVRADDVAYFNELMDAIVADDREMKNEGRGL